MPIGCLVPGLGGRRFIGVRSGRQRRSKSALGRGCVKSIAAIHLSKVLQPVRQVESQKSSYAAQIVQILIRLNGTQSFHTASVG
jgi:hypothetical protein